MAHYAKYKKGALGVMARHYERRKDENGEYVMFGNEDIDSSRSHLNYNLGPARKEKQAQYLHRRIGEVKCLNRKDVTVMCSWVITAPKDLPATDNERFFQTAYDFLHGRYGGKEGKNVMSAYVHMDETTPHMHFAFVPVTPDKKTGMPKVAASELVTRQDLKTFHDDLHAQMTATFGRDIGVLNGATGDGNKSKVQLQAEEAAQKLAMLQGEAKTLEEQKNGLEGKIEGLTRKADAELERKDNYSRQIDGMRGEAIALENQCLDLRKEVGADYAMVNALREQRSELQRQIEGLRGCKNEQGIPKGEPGLTGKKVSFSKENADRLKEWAENYQTQSRALKKANKAVVKLEAQLNDVQRRLTSEISLNTAAIHNDTVKELEGRVTELEQKNLNQSETLKIIFTEHQKQLKTVLNSPVVEGYKVLAAGDIRAVGYNPTPQSGYKHLAVLSVLAEGLAMRIDHTENRFNEATIGQLSKDVDVGAALGILNAAGIKESDLRRAHQPEKTPPHPAPDYDFGPEL